MRIVLMSCVVLAGCSLYFKAEPPSSGIDGGVIEPGGDDTNNPIAMARCEDGTLREIHVMDYQPDQPSHGAGDMIGHCASTCRSAAWQCPGNDCSGAEHALCEATASEGAICSLEGAPCTSPIATCPQTSTCGESLTGPTCACSDGTYHCTQQPLTAAVQQQLVGKWQGMVHPPPFSDDYAVSLWIYPDGTYWAECDAQDCTAFYYGGDGPHPRRTITVLSADETRGAWADIGIYFGLATPNMGAIQSLVVTDTTLRFTFAASWFGCGQPFQFDLRRAPSSVQRAARGPR
jgi:hypothetical protein